MLKNAIEVVMPKFTLMILVSFVPLFCQKKPCTAKIYTVNIYKAQGTNTDLSSFLENIFHCWTTLWNSALKTARALQKAFCVFLMQDGLGFPSKVLEAGGCRGASVSTAEHCPMTDQSQLKRGHNSSALCLFSFSYFFFFNQSCFSSDIMCDNTVFCYLDMIGRFLMSQSFPWCDFAMDVSEFNSFQNMP